MILLVGSRGSLRREGMKGLCAGYRMTIRCDHKVVTNSIVTEGTVIDNLRLNTSRHKVNLSSYILELLSVISMISGTEQY